MPRGKKPGEKPKNCVGNSNSGRKSKVEEFEMVITETKEKIKSEAIIELANSIGFKALKQLAEKESISSLTIKDIVLPIMLKGMTEKFEGGINLKSKTKEQLTKDLSDKIMGLLGKG